MFQREKLPTPGFIRRPIQELGIGTFSNIATVQLTSTLYDALSIFVERRVSALPVVDGHGSLPLVVGFIHELLRGILFEGVCLFLSGKVVALYSRFDVIVSTVEEAVLIWVLNLPEICFFFPFGSIVEPSCPEDLQQLGHDDAGSRPQAHLLR